MYLSLVSQRVITVVDVLSAISVPLRLQLPLLQPVEQLLSSGVVSTLVITHAA